MTHQEALDIVTSILNKENTTWHEKKNLLADYIQQLTLKQ